MAHSIWLLIGQRVRSISRSKKEKGGIHMYAITILLILACCIFMKVLADNSTAISTRDEVDDCIVVALTSSGSAINLGEKGRSGQIVIYHTISPVGVVMDGHVIRPSDYNSCDDPEIFAPAGDVYLENAYQRFTDSINYNLRLDAAGATTYKGITSPITVTDYSVYNKFLEFDSAGNVSGFRFVKYTRNASGTWSVYPYNKNVYPITYNSHDYCDTTVTQTSVSATLNFDVKVSDYKAWMGRNGVTEDSLTLNVSYQRTIDIRPVP